MSLLSFSKTGGSWAGLVHKVVTHLAAVMLLAGAALTSLAAEAQHPNLILTIEDVAKMRQYGDELPDLAAAIKIQRAQADAQLRQPIEVPVPRDAGGGYTHEQHKRNYNMIYNMGVLYQLTGKDAYAQRVKAMLMAYAKMYPGLTEHPKKKEQTPGRLFWQSLNESVWLVHVIQGFDAIATTLSAQERQNITQNLLLPVADFLSKGQPQTFDKIHNHGTWAVAAVGMTGYVLDKPELVQQALYGLDKSGKSGFLKQLQQLFSPDGYYSEGPYYQRYALMPFVLFATAIDTRQPELDIFGYRDGVLLKAIYTCIQLSYAKLFFPINDAIKDKGIDTVELVHGAAVAYQKTKDPGLLDISRRQGYIPLTSAGLAVAQGLAAGRLKAFAFKSMLLRDGPKGDKGALAIFRSGEHMGHQALVMKNTGQGLGHGHFDKLNWLLYDNGNEIVVDYGAARFLNIEAKYGGHYLPENKTWAKQSIAHNTLVVDETSHFRGNTAEGEKHAPKILHFAIKPKVELVSAEMRGAYKDTEFTRTMAFINIPTLDYPLVLDLLRVDSQATHQYDLPVHYQGHIIEVSFPLNANSKRLEPLGAKNGYQHLWKQASGKPAKQLPSVTWLLGNRFYTYSTTRSRGQEFIFAQIGANDPNFSLRPQPAIIQRVAKAKQHTFAALLETHGEYNPVAEYTVGSKSSVTDINLFEQDELDYVEFTLSDGSKWALAVSYNQDKSKRHRMLIDGRRVTWRGYFKLFEHK